MPFLVLKKATERETEVSRELIYWLLWSEVKQGLVEYEKQIAELSKELELGKSAYFLSTCIFFPFKDCIGQTDREELREVCKIVSIFIIYSSLTNVSAS